MASGCTRSNTSSGWFEKLIPDSGVMYTGPAIPSLGICTGDTLKEIEAIILGKIIDFSTGTGIFISDIDLTACKLFTTYITCCNGPGTVSKELKDLIKIIFDALCKLDSRLTVVEDYITDLANGPYSTGCLVGLPTNPTLKQILQQLLIEFCALKTAVTNLQNQVNNISNTLNQKIGDFLLAHINSCQGPGMIKKSGTGATAMLDFLGSAPIGAVTAFDGDMSWFDGTGLGRPNTPACGWALCNGNNGTKNMQGMVVVGTTAMLTPAPASADGGSYANGDTGGKRFVTLTSAQIPSVSFSGSTATGTGSIKYYRVSRKHASTGDNTMSYQFDGGGTSTPDASYTTDLNFTVPGQSISGSTDGGGGSHENRMPYVALEWIKRVS